MNIEEARAALQAEQGECWHERSGAEGRNHVMTKADAYALAAHVEACEHPPIRPTCGLEDAYCDVARKIKAQR